ncbi:U6 snRNA phosphodiesterase Usb1 [Chytriomyces cf. hyalinus JEL632]|nr:U6 snRNA phosphodiesterase Usb1 [Chytriomyces cf. hyalinus JEL632]
MAPLVDYSSDSDADSELDQVPLQQPGKRRRLLPPPVLPDSTINKYKQKVEQRLRIQNFVPGNWSTVVHVTVEPPEHIALFIANACDKMRARFQTFEQVSPLHISLSRTIFLKEFHIARFIQLLKTGISAHSSFDISLAKFNAYSNDDQSKHFLSIDVGAGSTQLEQLTTSVNSVVKQFSEPEFYKDPKFHASIGYILDTETMSSASTHENEMKGMFQDTEIPQDATFSMHQVVCKTGNQVFCVPLK